MLTGTLIALFLTIFIIWIFIQKSRKSRKYVDSSKALTTIPGMDPSDADKGNIEDIAKAGSFPKFLQELHSQFGPIASFWYGPTLTISLASADQFKKTAPIFDRHPEMFACCLPLISDKSIQFQNGFHGRDLYKRLSLPFSHGPSLSLAPGMTQLAKEMCKTWTDGTKIEIHQEIMKLALHNITSLQFGVTFECEKLMEKFHDLYTFIMSEMDDLIDGFRDLTDVEREKKFNAELDEFKEIIRKVVCDHKEKRESGDYTKAPFLDTLLDYTDDMDEIISQSITFMVGGFHTTGNSITWALYYLSLHPEVQEKLRKEVGMVVGERGVEGQQDLDGLVYMEQVINESFRLARIAPFSTRIAIQNLKIDGHSIPEGTHLLNALCVSLMDPQVFPSPHKFDPDRFSPDNISHPSLASSPFGFGVRKCPGYKFAKMEMVTALAVVVQRFRMEAVELEGGEWVKPKFGFVTKPQEDIWINIHKIEN